MEGGTKEGRAGEKEAGKEGRREGERKEGREGGREDIGQWESSLHRQQRELIATIRGYDD